MAPKRPSPLEEPPAAASSSEEEESEEENEEEEGDSGEESEEEPPPLKKPASPPPPARPVDKKPSSSSLKKPDSQPTYSSSDDGSDPDSESDSDSDNPPRPASSTPDPNVKPIASKPMDDASKLKKPRSKPSVPASATPTKSAAAKRPIDNSGDGKESKRAKKKVADADVDVEGEEKKSGDDAKKQLFQRLWSEDDEIAILKGMIEYSSKKGADPSAEMNAFHDFIKKSLHVDVTRTQLVDKVRRLKKKYENNLGRGKKGADRTFSKPHEQKAYDLSKKIWGGEVNNGGVEQSNANGKARRSQKSNNKTLTPLEKEQLISSLRDSKEAPQKEVEQSSGPSRCVSESIRFSKSMSATGLDEDVVKQGLDMIGGPKRSELEEKWRKLQMAEMELFLRRVELIREQTKLVLDMYKASEH